MIKIHEQLIPNILNGTTYMENTHIINILHTYNYNDVHQLGALLILSTDEGRLSKTCVHVVIDLLKQESYLINLLKIHSHGVHEPLYYAV